MIICQTKCQKIKETVGTVKFNDVDDQLPDYIILKNVILIICDIKDDAKFYPQIFLEEVLYNE